MEGELIFPLLCHYRIVAEDREGMAFVIETVLLEMDVQAPLREGNRSTGGKYRTFQFDYRVESQKQMNAIDAALRAIEGVRMVL